MRDFLPAEVRKRNYVINIIKEVYESYGFEPLETPAIENLETLTGKYGEEGGQLMFKILKRGEKLDLENAKKESDLSDLALRYDLTVPLARVVANNKNELPKYFKRYQIQPVWRADRPARGRFREFYQCDVDTIGSNSMVVEAELISAVSAILTRLGFDDFEIRLNHRELLFSILDSAEVSSEHRIPTLTALDKLDKITFEEFLNELRTIGLSNTSVTKLSDLVSNVNDVWQGGVAMNEVNLAIKLPGDISMLEELSFIHRFAKNSRLKVHPFLARGLSYYTGAIMEIVLLNGDFAGSIGGGGRYDGLIGMFGKEQIPACGFSLGLERILVVMNERGMFPPEIAESTPADVMVTIWNEESISESLKRATELRSQGLRVTVYPEVDKAGKQFKYADSIRVPFVCVLGDDEIKVGKVTLQDMSTREKVLIEVSEVAAHISQIRRSRGDGVNGSV